MDIMNQMNQFLNNVDPVGIALQDRNEYDIEAKALIANYDPKMSPNDVHEMFTACFEYYFNSVVILEKDELEELFTILTQSQ